MMPGTSSMARILKSALNPAASDWRAGYNPLRGLTIAHAVSLMEAGERGDFSDLQWAYRFIEKRYPVLSGLVARYEAGIGILPLQFKATPEKDLPRGATAAMAEAQRVALRTAYDRIGNLDAALRHLVSARFRGFAHLEILRDSAGEIARLDPIPQWHWKRCRKTEAWSYHAAANSAGPGVSVADVPLIVREVARPLNEIALINFCRASMSEKDWDAYIEVFGIPAIFVTMPPSVPTGKEAEYQDTAEAIVGDARGVLPNGADVKTVTAEKGTNPFKERATHLDEQVVLTGTGGKLTMLTESGSGTLAGGAHADAWRDIIAGEGAELSELLWNEVDALILAQKFPGQPILAYTVLGYREKTDVAALATTLVSLAAAGYRADAGQVSERTGWTLTPSPIEFQAGTFPPLANRAQTAKPRRKARKTRRQWS
jgi:phage gp29-like protein